MFKKAGAGNILASPTLLKDGAQMGVGVVEGLWWTLAGKVIWSRVVHFRNGGSISFRFKRRKAKHYGMVVFKDFGSIICYSMDRRGLQDFADAVSATRKVLDSSTLQALEREKEAELKQLGRFDRILRRVTNTPLWREVIVLGGGEIFVRIRRATDRQAEIVLTVGEGGLLCFPMNIDETWILETAILAAEAELEKLRNPARRFNRAASLS